MEGWYHASMMALAAGLPTSFRDREDVRPEGETSLEMRQVLAGPTTTFWGVRYA